jgi:hypothetical protein
MAVATVKVDKLGNRVRSRTITAQNQWTDPIYVKKGAQIEIEGTLSTAKINYQIKDPDNGSWIDCTDNDGTLYNFNAAGTFTILPAMAGEYRAGCRTGDFTGSPSGVIVTIRGK